MGLLSYIGFLFDTIIYGIGCAALWLVESVRLLFTSNRPIQSAIKMVKVKSVAFIETRHITPDKDGGFVLHAGIKPTEMEIMPNTATWSEDQQTHSSGIYAFQNVLRFTLKPYSTTRSAARSAVAAIVTLEDDTLYLVADLRISTVRVERSGPLKRRVYQYRADNMRRAVGVNVVTTDGEVRIVPAPMYYNVSTNNFLGANLLGR